MVGYLASGDLPIAFVLMINVDIPLILTSCQDNVSGCFSQFARISLRVGCVLSQCLSRFTSPSSISLSLFVFIFQSIPLHLHVLPNPLRNHNSSWSSVLPPSLLNNPQKSKTKIFGFSLVIWQFEYRTQKPLKHGSARKTRKDDETPDLGRAPKIQKIQKN